MILTEKEEAIIEFKNYMHKDKIPVVVYCDFECYLENVENDPKVYQKHVPSSIGMYIHHSYAPGKSGYIAYRQKSLDDESPEKGFVRQLKKLHSDIKQMIRNQKPLSQWDEKSLRKAEICHICEKVTTNDDKRVRDHCYITGKYR